MSQSHLNDLHDGLVAAGWQILEQRPGDEWTLAGSWKVRRSTQHDPIMIDFEILSEGAKADMENADLCRVRSQLDLFLALGDTGDTWKGLLRAFINSLDFSEGRFTLLYTLGEHGSAMANVWAEGQRLTIWFWHLNSNPLGELAHGISDLLRSPELTKITSAWPDEPGQNCWVVERQGNDVSVRIIYFRGTSSQQADEEGEIEVATVCSLQRLAAQVEGQMRRLLAEFGEDGYQERWRSPFPMTAFTELSELL